MGDFGRELKNFFKKGDMILLVMCLAISAFSCLVIASVTNAEKFGSSTRYILIQIGATGLGVLVYAIMSSIDLEFFSEHRLALTVFNIGLLLLLIPFGRSVSGNKSWLDFSFLPFDIQPAEICKIFYILVAASVMSSHQNRLSSVSSVVHMAYHMILIVGILLLTLPMFRVKTIVVEGNQFYSAEEIIAASGIKEGDEIIYKTRFGTRTYAVSVIKSIEETDWTDIVSSSEVNQVTLMTCIEEEPAKRLLVQAVQK